MVKKVVFITGTRADFGKLRSLLDRMHELSQFELHIFVTGMHMLSKYGSTATEVEKRGYPNIYKYINQNYNDTMDTVLGKTIQGLSDYIKEIQPDMIVVHGDRVETLAGATVGALNNILVAHIEGGEVSGTVDEIIRHAVSKLSNLHFVSNERAKQRLLQLGENASRIYVIGSPDVDAMFADDLPPIEKVRQWYEIPFEDYAILLFHPVTTEHADTARQAQEVVNAAIESGDNFVAIYPNNDMGSDFIINEYQRLEALSDKFRIIPSMRFEYFLTLMKHADYMLGNSSSALMEAPYYGVPSVDVGSRQFNRACIASVVHSDCEKSVILHSIDQVKSIETIASQHFGQGNSANKFIQYLSDPQIWRGSGQKRFYDRVVAP